MSSWSSDIFQSSDFIALGFVLHLLVPTVINQCETSRRFNAMSVCLLSVSAIARATILVDHKPSNVTSSETQTLRSSVLPNSTNAGVSVTPLLLLAFESHRRCRLRDITCDAYLDCPTPLTIGFTLLLLHRQSLLASLCWNSAVGFNCSNADHTRCPLNVTCVVADSSVAPLLIPASTIQRQPHTFALSTQRVCGPP